MPLYEKFGLDSQLFKKENFDDDQRMLLTYLNKTPPHIDLVSSYKQSLVSDSSRICLNYYMIDEKDRIEHYARPMFDYTLEYFFGEWRKVTPVDGKIGEEFVKRVELWTREHRFSILWASVLGEGDKIKEISKYPDDLTMFAEAWETKEKKAWYTLLAIYLREGNLNVASKYVELIENGKKKREKLLLSVLRTIVAKNADDFTKKFKVYMKHYKSHEYTQRSVPEKLAIDGTILLNLAKHQGMDIKFPEEYIDHYIFLD